MSEYQEYDYVVIGSGFGGAVSAMRLAQKGYSVAVLERGVWRKNSDYPKTNWNIFKYLWAPVIRCFGIQKITLINKVMVLHGMGVGGGSQVYANTLMRAGKNIFESKFWPQDTDWHQELSEHYHHAERMLGVTTNEHLEEGEMAIKKIGDRLGVGDTFHPTEVGIFFGEPNKNAGDPYFNGDGPDRVGCNICGACMIGCPNGAKNTLDKNYLYFAQKWGGKIFAETTAKKIIPQSGGGYLIETTKTKSLFGSKGQTFKAKNVVMAAGVLGTMDILLKNKNIYKTLPNISPRLGDVVRTNNESLLGATSLRPEVDMSKGIAIGAAIQADEYTKIEGVRYPKGSDLLRFLAVPLTGAGNWITRPLKMVASIFTNFGSTIRVLLLRDWAKSTLILLVMQSIETQMSLVLKRSKLFPFKKKLAGKVDKDNVVPCYIPVAQEAAKHLADEVGGVAQNISSEVLIQTPATAHILGGAVMGKDAEEGVIDSNHEVYGYKGLFVTDASAIPTNLAVNPSLTITALAERFASKVPVKSEEFFNDNQITYTADKVN